jgi:hypothetical protein
MSTTTTVNRKFPIPNEGGLSPSGPAVSELVVIRIYLPVTNFLQIHQGSLDRLINPIHQAPKKRLKPSLRLGISRTNELVCPLGRDSFLVALYLPTTKENSLPVDFPVA